MSGVKLTPRQKKINMMYLVLTMLPMAVAVATLAAAVQEPELMPVAAAVAADRHIPVV
jgi:hypothetical protein